MPEKFKSIKTEYNNLDISMVAIALLIIAIGLNPEYILNKLIIPQRSHSVFHTK